MKRLLLLALPICLLGSLVVRADEAAQPAAQTETKATEAIDPKIVEFNAILNDALSLDSSKVAFETIQKNVNAAFATAENAALAQDIAAKFPQAVGSFEGKPALGVNLGAVAIILPEVKK